MEEPPLEKILMPLMEAQIMNNLMIKTGLLKFPPDDQYMIELYKTQDDIYSQIRRVIEATPSVKNKFLADFDKLLYDYRLNLILALQKIGRTAP